MRKLLGYLLVKGGLVKETELDRALTWQRETNAQLGEILIGMGCLNDRQLHALLRIQGHLSDPERALRFAAGIRLRLGEILVDSGRVTPQQLEDGLAEQQRTGAKLGEIAVRRRWIERAELERALQFQGIQTNVHPAEASLRLGELLVATGYITREDLESALERQRDSGRPLGVELVDAGCLQPAQLATVLRLQRSLVSVALSVVLAVGAISGAVPAQAAPAAAGAEVAVGATVLRHASVRLLSAPRTVEITEADIARGYVDVAVPSRLEIRSNSHAGYMLTFETQADFARGTEVRGLGDTAALGRSGGVLSVPGSGAGMQQRLLELSFRVLLSQQARPGVHPWPMQLSVVPL